MSFFLESLLIKNFLGLVMVAQARNTSYGAKMGDPA
jgi:hypothetical protein